MSHVAVIKVVVKDLDVLAQVAAKFGMVLNRGQTRYRWYGKWVNDYHGTDAAYANGIKPEDYGKCEHALSIPDQPNAYEVGVVKNPKGDGWVLIYDFWGSGGRAIAERTGGQDMRSLVQAYSETVAAKECQQLEAEGWQMSREVQPNGDVHLVLNKPY